MLCVIWTRFASGDRSYGQRKEQQQAAQLPLATLDFLVGGSGHKTLLLVAAAFAAATAGLPVFLLMSAEELLLISGFKVKG